MIDLSSPAYSIKCQTRLWVCLSLLVVSTSDNITVTLDRIEFVVSPILGLDNLLLKFRIIAVFLCRAGGLIYTKMAVSVALLWPHCSLLLSTALQGSFDSSLHELSMP